MARKFEAVIEVIEVTNEYYRYIPSGLVATLDQVHNVRSTRSLEGYHTTKYILTFVGRDYPKEVWGVDFFNGNWEEVSKEEYCRAKENS
jgi:hypothetical protein